MGVLRTPPPFYVVKKKKWANIVNCSWYMINFADLPDLGEQDFITRILPTNLDRYDIDDQSVSEIIEAEVTEEDQDEDEDEEEATPRSGTYDGVTERDLSTALDSLSIK